MQAFEREWFDTWLAGIKSCDTDDDFKAKKEAQEEAVWFAVDNFGVSYVDAVNSWIMEAASQLRNDT